MALGLERETGPDTESRSVGPWTPQVKKMNRGCLWPQPRHSSGSLSSCIECDRPGVQVATAKLSLAGRPFQGLCRGHTPPPPSGTSSCLQGKVEPLTRCYVLPPLPLGHRLTPGHPNCRAHASFPQDRSGLQPWSPARCGPRYCVPERREVGGGALPHPNNLFIRIQSAESHRTRAQQSSRLCTLRVLRLTMSTQYTPLQPDEPLWLLERCRDAAWGGAGPGCAKHPHLSRGLCCPAGLAGLIFRTPRRQPAKCSPSDEWPRAGGDAPPSHACPGSTETMGADSSLPSLTLLSGSTLPRNEAQGKAGSN